MPEVRTVSGAAEIERVAHLTAHYIKPESYEQVKGLLVAALTEGTVLNPDRCAVYLNDDGVIVAALQVIEFDLNIGFSSLKTAGLSSVVVEPAYWGRDCAQTLLDYCRARADAASFQLMFGFGLPHFYERFGATSVVPRCHVKIDARRIKGRPDRAFRAADPSAEDDVALLLRLYAEANRGRTGTVVRTPALWKWSYMRPAEFRVREDAYFGFDLEDDALFVAEVGGGSLLDYRDALFAACAEARERGLRWVRGEVPCDGLFVRAAVPYGVTVELDYRASGFWMGRMLGIADFFTKITPELNRRLRASGGPRVALTLASGEESVTLQLEGGGAGEAVAVELRLPRPALLQLAFGYREPTDILDEQGARLADRELVSLLFPRSDAHVWRANRF